jgi:hypothetical protein
VILRTPEVGIGIGVASGIDIEMSIDSDLDPESDSDPDIDEHKHLRQMSFMHLGVLPVHGPLFRMPVIKTVRPGFNAPRSCLTV